LHWDILVTWFSRCTDFLGETGLSLKEIRRQLKPSGETEQFSGAQVFAARIHEDAEALVHTAEAG